MFQRYRDEEPFHHQATIAQAMEGKRRAMREAINRLPEVEIKTVPTDQLAQGIAQKFAIDIPILDESDIRPSRREIDIDISNDPTRRPYHAGRGGIDKATEIIIPVPFQGDAEAFRLHASSHTMEYPLGRIEAAVIVFRKLGTNLDGVQVRREFDEWLAQIKRHLAGMTRELGAFNDALRVEALTLLNGRLAKLKRDDDVLAGLGFGSVRKQS